MKFNPEKYRIADVPMQNFLDPEEIKRILDTTPVTAGRVEEIIQKSLNKNRLSLEETAVLIKTEDVELVEKIKEAARTLKRKVYGNRIVLFAPLYVGNHCTNNCSYCGFRTSNKDAVRKSLSDSELVREVEALEETGQKRLILVYGEHPRYSPEYIAHTAQLVYRVKKGQGEIRRVNINAAPLDIEGFRTVKNAGIGTYQVFQETYHPEVYEKYHLSGKKRDYQYRITALDRAQEAGLDDVGIGVLFGLYDWRFEVLSLIRHTNHLEAVYNIGPHTISFPRYQEASTSVLDPKYQVSDADFLKLVAILRLAVPYTGLILTAREPEHIRREVIKYGVSQIDGGTRIEIGSYQNQGSETQDLNREQFKISDDRSLSEVIDELLDDGMLPSFCTACYRNGRTGEHFMEFSCPGFIKRFCSPNAMLTLAEYLEDYGNEQVKLKGWKIIEKSLGGLNGGNASVHTHEVRSRIEKIKAGERDLYF